MVKGLFTTKGVFIEEILKMITSMESLNMKEITAKHMMEIGSRVKNMDMECTAGATETFIRANILMGKNTEKEK